MTENAVAVAVTPEDVAQAVQQAEWITARIEGRLKPHRPPSAHMEAMYPLARALLERRETADFWIGRAAALLRDLEQVRADLDAARADAARWREAAVLAVLPLEALNMDSAMGGADYYRRHLAPEVWTGIQEGITAVRDMSRAARTEAP